MAPMEILEHMADIGLRATGNSREEALAIAAMGMFSLMTDRSSVEEEKAVEIRIKGANDEELLFNFMDDLLFRFEVDAFLVRRVVVEQFTKRAIKATAYGEEKNKHHHIRREIKSVTYHQMKIESSESGCVLEVFFDV